MAMVVLLIAGCQGGGDSPPSTTTGPDVTSPEAPPITTPAVPITTPATPPSPCPGDAEHPWGTESSEREFLSTVSGQEITGVRIGSHECFDRVVLDLTGDDPGLGWYASFQAEAIHDPSGDPIEMEGDAFLDLAIRPIDWVEDSEERYHGDGVSGEDTELVTEVRFGGLFEGYQQVIIGLRSQTAYRVFALSDPARIVIDVKHP